MVSSSSSSTSGRPARGAEDLRRWSSTSSAMAEDLRRQSSRSTSWAMAEELGRQSWSSGYGGDEAAGCGLRFRRRSPAEKRNPATRTKHVILARLLAWLVLGLPEGVAGVFSDHISVGFSGSAMAYVDTNGAFLYSLGSTFELSFFTPQDQTIAYLCVLHSQSQAIVWTANRDTPISLSDQLVFSQDGNAALLAHGNATVWSSRTSGLGGALLQLHDSGNLALLDSANRTLWQSFDHPTDTLLAGQVFSPGMKIVSSSSPGSLSSGSYYLSLQQQQGDLRLFLDDASSSSPAPYWSMLQDPRPVKSGTGTPSYAVLNSTGLSLVSLVGGDSLVVSQLSLNSNASLCRASLEYDGNLHIYVYSVNTWTPQFVALTSGCLLPLFCGHFGVCNSDQCSCPDSFQPLNAKNITQGCQAPATPPCSNSSSSTQLAKVADGMDYFANQFTVPVKTPGLDSCKQLCMQNCSCSSLFYYNESGSCFLLSELATIQSTNNYGHALYVKTNGLVESPNGQASSDTASHHGSAGIPAFVVPAIVGGTGFIIVGMVCVFIYWFLKVRSLTFPGEDNEEDDNFLDSIPGLPARFSFKDLECATNNFSKRLGCGGFGSVYEGVLPDKTKVAVKQLESLGQGKKEFRAEVAIIGSIHHVHLVQLRGFCAEGSHRLLVYEFMSNSSLDKCLFVDGGDQSQVLEWNTRYKIALGTARGLAYLHNDCREKIIHCDIKPENILLDESYNAKVSDFGLAKLITKEQSQVFTTLRGTRGYLAPEWLLNLAISEKSDVYSFGMVLLEIISGRKNFDSSESSEKWYFPAYAFQQAEQGKLEDLVDSRLKGSVCNEQVVQAVKIALWCIQEDTPARPSMAKVVQMLEGNVTVLDPPLSSQFAVRLHARMVEAINSTEQSSSASDYNHTRELLSAVQLSAPR